MSALARVLDDALATGSVSTAAVEDAVLTSVPVERLVCELARRGMGGTPETTVAGVVDRLARADERLRALEALAAGDRALLERVADVLGGWHDTADGPALTCDRDLVSELAWDLALRLGRAG